MVEDTTPEVDLNEVPTSTPELNAEEGVVPQGEAAEDVDTTENAGTADEEEPVAPEVAE